MAAWFCNTAKWVSNVMPAPIDEYPTGGSVRRFMMLRPAQVHGSDV
jgi:hypothetical protein